MNMLQGVLYISMGKVTMFGSMTDPANAGQRSLMHVPQFLRIDAVPSDAIECREDLGGQWNTLQPHVSPKASNMRPRSPKEKEMEKEICLRNHPRMWFCFDGLSLTAAAREVIRAFSDDRYNLLPGDYLAKA